MKNQVLDVSGNKALELQVDTAISFTPFIRFLEQRIGEGQSLKTTFYKTILNYAQEHKIPEGDIPLEEVNRYGDFMEYIYSSVSPPLVPERELAWGLSFPLQPRMFYGTDLLFEMMAYKETGDPYTIQKTPATYHKERLHLIYSLILQRLYNFQVPVKIQQYHSWVNKETGLQRYYEVNINADFVEVSAKEALPPLNFGELYSRFTEEDGHQLLEKVLPLNMFRFRGFAVLTVTDVTAQMAVENIEKVRLKRLPGHNEERYNSVIRSLKTLVQDNGIEFDLFPFVRVNNQAVYGYEQAGTGILFAVWGETRLSPEEFRKQAESYAAKPISFFSPDINGEHEMKIAFLDTFRELGVRSLALTPLFYDEKPVGVLCMHTWQDSSFDEKILAMLEPAFAPIAQLLQVYIDEFNLELDNIIKERFTSLQPSVQWKFNEAAWHLLHHRKRNLPPPVEHIQFKDVYPLYGAIDIRNSTIERNAAIRADLVAHLDLLSQALISLQAFDNSSLMQEQVYNCSRWKQILKQEDLSSIAENELNMFLTESTRDYLLHLSRQEPKTEPIIREYMESLSASGGIVHYHRNELEKSMQMINTAVNDYFEQEKEQLQRSYPCYFEKFRTDGIEYDIYIGQSIAPQKSFDHFHLKNLRLWQLSSMAAVARLTYDLRKEMPHELRTTQLIFLHNHMIDISFRNDERKFDVEGAYNIRYQMIKKRIDKVRIRNSNERLTQPDTIALIYMQPKDVEDYLPFINYLQDTHVLTAVMEDFELEDLQGLSGLRALRMGVVYPEKDDIPDEE